MEDGIRALEEKIDGVIFVVKTLVERAIAHDRDRDEASKALEPLLQRLARTRDDIRRSNREQAIYDLYVGKTPVSDEAPEDVLVPNGFSD